MSDSAEPDDPGGSSTGTDGQDTGSMKEHDEASSEASPATSKTEKTAGGDDHGEGPASPSAGPDGSDPSAAKQDQSDDGASTQEDGTSSQEAAPETEADIEKVPAVVALGANGSWFIRWSNGQCAWDRLPRSLHEKLRKRDSKLPGIKHLSLSETEEWFASFDDGSFAISDSCRDAILNALQDRDNEDAEVNQLVFCPNGGFIITRDNGAISSQRIPVTLTQVVAGYQDTSVNIAKIAISKIGGWFVQFSDSDCRWQDLPPRLEAILANLIRKDPDSIILAFSPTDHNTYFVSFGSFICTTLRSQSFIDAIDWAEGKPLPSPAILTSTPPIHVESYSGVYGQFFELLRNINSEPPANSSPANSPRAQRSSTTSDLARNSPTRITSQSSQPSLSPVDPDTGRTREYGSPSHNGYRTPDNRNPESCPPRPSARSQVFSNILSSVTSMFSTARPAPPDDSPSRKSLIDSRTLVSDRLSSVLAALRSRHDSLDSSSPNKEASARLSERLSGLIQLVEASTSHDSLAALASDAEFLSLYADGWLEATSLNPAPSPWLDGWFQGRFGCDLDSVEWIVKNFAPAHSARSAAPNTVINHDQQQKLNPQSSSPPPEILTTPLGANAPGDSSS